MLYILVMFS